MFGNNPYIRLLKKFYRKGALTPKQISKITKCEDIENDHIIRGLLNEGVIEKNTTDKPFVSNDPYIVQAGFYETDENKPYRITQKGANQGRVDTITENTIRYFITTAIAVIGLVLSVYCTFFKV